MTKRLTLTEAITLLARRRPRTAAAMMAEAKQAIEAWERDHAGEHCDPQSLFGGSDDLDAAGDLIMASARDNKLNIWGRPGNKSLTHGDLPARELITEKDLQESIAINLLRNDLAPDDRDGIEFDEWRGARRVRFFDLQVKASEVEALRHPAIEASDAKPKPADQTFRKERSNPPGPRPIKTDAIAAQMVADFAGDLDRLQKAKQEELRTTYRCSRDTAEKARGRALARLIRTPTNSDTTPIIDK